MENPVRLDIGCGATVTDGFTPIDKKDGRPAVPLSQADGSVDEIRASHVLEHYSHREVASVLSEWVRTLKPGGRLRIAVPDFEKIARGYLSGAQMPIEGYVMGGHVDDHDHHGALFDRETLTDLMESAGLIGIAPWKSDAQDCSSLPISLNLYGYKPPAQWPTVRAVMSTPRLGWNDMWGVTLEALMRLGIKLTKHTGAFWEQCITRAMIEALESGPEWILSLDYDTVFHPRDLQDLLFLAMQNPDEVHAIAGLQSHRQKSTPLMTLRGENGMNATTVPMEVFTQSLVRCRTAHFGFTLLRASALRTMPQPWFAGAPDESGEWGEGRTDPDIHFWRKWEEHGHSLYVAPRIPVGHLEPMIRWPGEDMQAILQHPNDFHATGRPAGAWK